MNARPTESPDPPTRILTVNEAAEAYADEWIFMQVTEYDQHHRPAAGIVLVHHRSRRGLAATEIAVMKSPPAEARGFYTFDGFPHFDSYEQLEAYQKRRQATDDNRS